MTGITLGKVAYSCEQYRLHVCGCCELGEHKGLTVELKHGYEGHASIRTLISPSFLVSDCTKAEPGRALHDGIFGTGLLSAGDSFVLEPKNISSLQTSIRKACLHHSATHFFGNEAYNIFSIFPESFSDIHQDHFHCSKGLSMRVQQRVSSQTMTTNA